ncbi:MAG: AEC family transporter [Aquisalimonadaceae bacterium]
MAQGAATLIAIITIIAPVFLLIVIGWGLVRWRFFSASALNEVNRLCYWVALPAALFHGISGAEPDFRAAGGLLTVILTATLLGMVLAWLFAGLSGMARQARGAFIQGMFRGNMVFVGLPVVLYALDANPAAGDGGAQSALLTIGPMIAIYNVLGVFVLLFAGNDVNRRVIRAAMIGMAANPLLLACIAGLLMSISGASLPVMLDRTVAATGQMALPLALIGVGGALALTRIQGHFGLSLIGAAMKVVLLPGIGFALAVWIGLSAEYTLIAVIMLATPTAAAAYVLTRQLKGDEALVSGIILLSHVVAVPAFMVYLLLAGL